MSNKYVDFISDEHFLKCVDYVFTVYEKQKEEVSEKKFYKNKVDPIRFTFDVNFLKEDFDLTEYLSVTEIPRQINKTIGNAIGTFHEMIFDGIKGYKRGNFDGYDIKATDNSLFADIKNKHNTVNSSSEENLYQKLISIAENHPKSKVYYVQIIAKKSINENWVKTYDKTKPNTKTRVYDHERVYIISADQFYKLLTGNVYAFRDVMEALPIAINDLLEDKEVTDVKENEKLLKKLKTKAEENNLNLIDQIITDNFNTYLGFDEWKK